MKRESKNFWQDAWAQLKRNKLVCNRMIGLILIIILALVGPLISKHDFLNKMSIIEIFQRKIPVLDKVHFYHLMVQVLMVKMLMQKWELKENYWFGTDQLGRDLWTRTWKGTQISSYWYCGQPLLDIFIGVVYGAISGFLVGE